MIRLDMSAKGQSAHLLVLIAWLEDKCSSLEYCLIVF